MRFSTFYFTATGNTWWAAREFTKIAKGSGHEADYYSIESEDMQSDEKIAKILMESDAIGFAYPIHGSMHPLFMQKFIDRVIEIRSKDETREDEQNWKIGYTITTMALFSGDGALVPRKQMKKANLRLKGAINLILASNLAVPYFRYNPVGTKKIERRKKYDRKKLCKLVRRLSEGKKYLEGRNPILISVGWLQRVFMKTFESKVYKYFSVNMDLCTRCMLCVNNCPTHSIQYQEDQFKFLSTCTSCMRCYNFCTANSILLFNKYANPKKYRRYHGPGEGFKIELLK